MIGLNKEAAPSTYQPGNEVRELTAKIRQDYQIGHEINHHTYSELNDESPISRMDIDQRAFNSYVEPSSNNPDEAWRANVVRPITRNRIISIAAHATATILIPSVFAQNDQDEEDKAAANIMRDLMEWVRSHSDYDLTMLYGVIAALVNPVAYLKADYAEVLQTIRKRNVDGSITNTQVIDEVLSGFRAMNVPADEILITNPYEFEIQRQKAVIRRRFISFDEAEALHGDNPNFNFVRPGVKVLYNDQDGMFYDQRSQDTDRIDCEEVIYYNRREDLEIPFVNGVYLGNEDIENNPFKHRTNLDAPLYPFVKFGYEPIDEKRFYFYKSAVFKLAPEQDVVDTMYKMVMDGTFLSVMPPVAVTGEDKIESDVIFPGAVTAFSEDAKITPIQISQNLPSAYRALEEMERSMNESSLDPLRAGVSSSGGRTAFEIARIEQNARIQLGLFGKMLARMVSDFGGLMVNDIVQHMSVGRVEELTGGNVRLNFRSFLLSDQSEDGRSISKEIRFDSSIEDKDQRKLSFDLLKKEGLKGGKRIYLVNPTLFARLKFLVRIEPDSLVPKNEAFERALKLEAYDRMIQDPLVQQDVEKMAAITRDFLISPFAKGDVDKYAPSIQQAMGGTGVNPLGVSRASSTNLINEITGNNSAQGLAVQ